MTKWQPSQAVLVVIFVVAVGAFGLGALIGTRPKTEPSICEGHCGMGDGCNCWANGEGCGDPKCTLNGLK